MIGVTRYGKLFIFYCIFTKHYFTYDTRANSIGNKKINNKSIIAERLITCEKETRQLEILKSFNSCQL